MPEAQPVLRFHSDALPDEDLVVTRLEGEERISRPYRFELELVSARTDLAIGPILRKPAWVGIEQGILSPDGDLALDLPLRLHGRIPTFEQVEKRDDAVVYKAALVPRLWKLSSTYQSRIFLGKTVPQIVDAVLQGAGFAKEDYELDLAKQGGYAVRDYVVQYEESDLDFLSRWLEHEGIFYFFRQGERGETVVFADSVNSYAPFRTNDAVRFLPDPGKVAGKEVEKTWFREESVQGFSCRYATIPRTVVLKDYNWRTPSLDLKCSAEVDAEGEGTVYEYNNHFKTPEEGDALARIRAEEIRCGSVTFRGSSDCRAFRVGATWKLAEHFRDEFNAAYLTTEVRHLASQPAQVSALRETRATYTNEFVCIPASRVFRPARVAPWPAIRGAMHAKIDGATDGTYAEIDAEGQYKVKLPLDLSDATGGHASRYVRMAQPYAGADHGMHFPLHKGTEVLLTHIDGDPDRPIITGAVPNAETASVVRDANATMSGVKTAGGNQIAMEDADGHQRIVLKAGGGLSGIAIGSGSADRVEITTPMATTMGWGSNLMGGAFSSVMGAASSSMTSGFTLAQVLIAAAKMSWNFLDKDLLGQYLKGGKDPKPDEEGKTKMAGLGWNPALAALITVPVQILGEMLFTKLFAACVKDHIQKVMKEQSMYPTAAATNSGFFATVAGVGTEIKNALIGASTYGFGAYLARCGGGTRIQLNRLGESILIASELSQVALYGQGVSMTAEHVAIVHGKTGFAVSTDEGASGVRAGVDGLSLNYKQNTLVQNDKGTEIRSPQGVCIGTEPGLLLDSPGKMTYLVLKSNGIAEISAKQRFYATAGGNNILRVDDGGILLLTSPGLDGCYVKAGADGELLVMAKSVKFVADTMTLGDASSAIKINGSSVQIQSSGSLKLSSGSPMTVNGQTFGPPPVPPVVTPVRPTVQAATVALTPIPLASGPL